MPPIIFDLFSAMSKDEAREEQERYARARACASAMMRGAARCRRACLPARRGSPSVALTCPRRHEAQRAKVPNVLMLPAARYALLRARA